MLIPSMDKGVLYIATGNHYVSEATRSARSLKSELPDIPTTIITDVSNTPEVFDSHIRLENPDNSNYDKVSNISKSPYTKTVFLDTDTYVHDKSGITDIFNMLDEFDFVACHGLGRRLETTIKKDDIPEVSVPDSFSWFNSGVVGFNNNENVQQVFDEWEERFIRHRKVNPNIFDQGALREALYYNDIHLATLPFEYNYHILHPQAVGDKVRVFHGHVDNFEQVADIVNKDPESKRYFHAIGGDRTAYLWTVSNREIRLRTFYLSIKKRGVSTTARKLVSWINGGKFWGN